MSRARAEKASQVLDGQTYARIECGQPECTHLMRGRESHAEAAGDMVRGGTGGGAGWVGSGTEIGQDRCAHASLTAGRCKCWAVYCAWGEDGGRGCQRPRRCSWRAADRTRDRG